MTALPPTPEDEELVLDGRLVEDCAPVRLVVRGGRVVDLVRLADLDTQTWIAPGWVDLQVNGWEGFDPNDDGVDAEVVAGMVRAVWRTGVVGCAVTICTSSEARLLRSFRAIAQARAADPLVAAGIVGIHVEGPHIAREDGPRGAHPLAHVRPPDIAEYRRWQKAAEGLIRIVTLSPEYPEAIPYIRALVADGVVVSVGHSAATGAQIRDAVDAGARWSTHLGNGAHSVMPRHPNYIWDQLAEDRLSAGFIFDGQHLPTSVMRPFVRAKGVERTILVSDAVAVGGLAPGPYELFSGVAVELTTDGRLQLRGTPYLAGAVAPLAVCVANAMRHAGVSLAEAVRMASANPARLLGIPFMAGHESVRVGSTANLTLFTQSPRTLDIRVVRTIVAGRTVHIAEPA